MGIKKCCDDPRPYFIITIPKLNIYYIFQNAHYAFISIEKKILKSIHFVINIIHTYHPYVYYDKKIVSINILCDDSK